MPKKVKSKKFKTAGRYQSRQQDDSDTKAEKKAKIWQTQVSSSGITKKKKVLTAKQKKRQIKSIEKGKAYQDSFKKKIEKKNKDNNNNSSTQNNNNDMM